MAITAIHQVHRPPALPPSLIFILRALECPISEATPLLYLDQDASDPISPQVQGSKDEHRSARGDQVSMKSRSEVKSTYRSPVRDAVPGVSFFEATRIALSSAAVKQYYGSKRSGWGGHSSRADRAEVVPGARKPPHQMGFGTRRAEPVNQTRSVAASG